MHQNITHNRDFKTFHEFRRAVDRLLRYEVPRRWGRFCDRITNNFRVIRRVIFGSSFSRGIASNLRNRPPAKRVPGV